MALGEKNNQLVRCHLLIWNNQLPSWLTRGSWTSETLQAVMKEHITKEVEHYKGQCYAWDVVNEALDDDANFRKDVFYDNIGDDYIRIAFETAALADPDVKLYYNDYNIEYAGAKATAALDIVTKLVNEGVKIDGVGLQGHFVVGSMPLHEDLITTMSTYTALGLEIAITEMDIRMPLPSTAVLLIQQKLDYENIVSACVNVDNCIGITAWDLGDKVYILLLIGSASYISVTLLTLDNSTHGSQIHSQAWVLLVSTMKILGASQHTTVSPPLYGQAR